MCQRIASVQLKLLGRRRTSMKYLLTGGATGGHVYPALAVADELRRTDPQAEFLYVGLRGHIEARIVPGRGYSLRYVRSRPFPRSLSITALVGFAATLLVGCVLAVQILLRFRPQVIISTGGFVSAPIVFAAGLLRKVGLSGAKIFLYEPNALPGLLNQAAGRLADRIGVAFEDAARWFDMKRVCIVGHPVRSEILQAERSVARRTLQLNERAKVVLVVGGSGGSKAMNRAVVEALPRLQQVPDIVILHVTGTYRAAEYDAVTDTEAHLQRAGMASEVASYRRFDYLDNIEVAYAAADLVVCRAGAATLTEISARRLPGILIPLPTAAEDHQAANARDLERRGGARILYQEARWAVPGVVSCVDPVRLAQFIEESLSALDSGGVAESAPGLYRADSLELILSEISKLATTRRPSPLRLEFPIRQGGLPSNPNALVRYVSRVVEEAGGPSGLDELERSYLCYQADRLLCSEGWFEIPLGMRNVGVKLVGILQNRRCLPLLLNLLDDRTPATLLRRLCGGDYCHPGILRRNVIEYGLRLLPDDSDEVFASLTRALAEDPYFEVRAAAAQLLGERFAGSRLEALIIPALQDRSPRVVVQAVRALGKVAVNAEVMDELRHLYEHPDWQFRQEVVGAISQLLDRGIIRAADVSGELDRILGTAPSFEPTFPLRDGLQTLAAKLHHMEETGGGAIDHRPGVGKQGS